MNGSVPVVSRVYREARRRKVFRTAALYMVGAWLALQVAALMFPGFGIPESAIRALIWAAVAGFPVAVVFGWLFEIGPGGIRRTAPAAAGEAALPQPLARSRLPDPRRLRSDRHGTGVPRGTGGARCAEGRCDRGGPCGTGGGDRAPRELDCGAAVREHQRGPRQRVFLRRHRRGDPRSARTSGRAQCDRAHLLVRVQGE